MISKGEFYRSECRCDSDLCNRAAVPAALIGELGGERSLIFLGALISFLKYL